jgi:ribosomal protein S27AE
MPEVWPLAEQVRYMGEIKSISFFNPDARKAANPHEHPCPRCGCNLQRIGVFWFIPARWLGVRVCGKCNYMSRWLYGREKEMA